MISANQATAISLHSHAEMAKLESIINMNAVFGRSRCEVPFQIADETRKVLVELGFDVRKTEDRSGPFTEISW